MKALLTIALMAGTVTTVKAQPVPLELMAGNNHLYYQHSVSKPLHINSGFGWSNVASIIIRYNNDPEKNGRPNEIMNQLHATYRFAKYFTASAGIFYTNVTDYRPSASIGFAMQKKDWLLIVKPRIDVCKNGAYELFSLAEYRPVLSENYRLYTRFQLMMNAGPHNHNRSYQQFRLGLEKNLLQFGIGINIDAYGPKADVVTNTGVFIRKELF